jgi:hypothetical protein
VDVGDRVDHMLFDLLFLCFCHALSLDRSAWALTGPCVGACALAAQRQTTSMTDATVATEVHQTLDIHRNFAAQIAFNFELIDGCTKLRHFGLSQILDRGRRIDAGRHANLLRARIANSVDRRQRDNDVLVQRYVYACYACH